MSARPVAVTDIPFARPADGSAQRSARVLERLPGDGYVLHLDNEGVQLEARHLRRERYQLYGELDIRCNWFGARTYNGSLSCGDMNFSSQTARSGRAKYCAARARTKDGEFDWEGVLDEFSLRVIQAERETSAGLVLDDAPDEGPPRDFNVYGLSIPADSHSQLICDGGGLKSLILLLVLGSMAKAGRPVALIDWEWNAQRHKARKLRMFGQDRLEHLHYLYCANPITVEFDHIRRFCDARGVEFIGIDSIGAAVDGKLADDDVARAYNRALTKLPPSLAAAHTPKNNNGATESNDLKAFGSAFFHNFSRQTWSVKKEQGTNEDLVTVLLKASKQNDGQRHKPVALEFAFSPEIIQVRNVDPAGVDGFVQSLPLAARMTHLLKGGPMTIAAMAERLEAKPDSIQKAVKRGEGKQFTCVPGPDRVDRWALIERRVS